MHQSCRLYVQRNACMVVRWCHVLSSKYGGCRLMIHLMRQEVLSFSPRRHCWCVLLATYWLSSTGDRNCRTHAQLKLNFYHPRMRPGSVFSRTCLTAIALHFDSLGPERSILICRYVFGIPRSCSSVRVTGTGERKACRVCRWSAFDSSHFKTSERT